MTAAATVLPQRGLRDALAAVERVFDVDELLDRRASEDDVVRYYHQSLALYLLMHSRSGAVHFALDGRDFSAHARIIARYLRPIGAARVLELASGQGYNAIRLSRELPGARITGVDLTPWHVRVARLRARGRANVGFEHGDFHRLRFEHHSFDAVCAVEGFCHARDLRTAMAEVARVLRPGGRFAVIDGFLLHDPASLTSDQCAAVRAINAAFAVSRTWTLDDFVAAGEELGLHAVAVDDLTTRVLPNADRLARIARYWLQRPRAARTLTRALPNEMTRNTIAATLIPAAVRSGAGGYHAVVLER